MFLFFFFQAEDGIRDLVRSRGLGDVYKRQARKCRRIGLAAGGGEFLVDPVEIHFVAGEYLDEVRTRHANRVNTCLLYTSDAADERSSVDLGGRRIIKQKNKNQSRRVLHS